MPGPACYGRGGTEPAVTDANLVLGRLDPGNFLGGEMRLEASKAGEVLDRRMLGRSATTARMPSPARPRAC
jgi:N-methylhydantoinase A